MQQTDYLKRLYANRFDPSQQKAKLALWQVLIREFLQKYVPFNSTVLDIGGGYCEFINQIRANQKFLIDLNPDAKAFAHSNVNVLNLDILQEDKNYLVPEQKFDIIFTSNFFEHLRSKEDLIEVLAFCYSRLKVGGSLLVIQPNFKYSLKEYYDFIDHCLPITDNSLKEILQAVGYQIDELIPRFLPFTTKGRPSSTLLLKLYLKMPIAWYFFGGQMFVKATRPC